MPSCRAKDSHSGSLNEKTDPCPSWLVTVIEPPWASTIAFAIDKPIPVPWLRSRCSWPRWNFSKIIACSAGATATNCADRALAGITLLAIARGNPRRESVLSNQHRLLGGDTRRRAVRRCQGDRGHEGVGEVAGGVDAG